MCALLPNATTGIRRNTSPTFFPYLALWNSWKAHGSPLQRVLVCTFLSNLPIYPPPMHIKNSMLFFPLPVLTNTVPSYPNGRQPALEKPRRTREKPVRSTSTKTSCTRHAHHARQERGRCSGCRLRSWRPNGNLDASGSVWVSYSEHKRLHNKQPFLWQHPASVNCCSDARALKRVKQIERFLALWEIT